MDYRIEKREAFQVVCKRKRVGKPQSANATPDITVMWQELAQKLNSENRILQKQNTELLNLNERLNSENRVGNIQALKNDLKKTKELLQSEKEKTHTAQVMIEECQDKQSQAEQERDYALTHQKK